MITTETKKIIVEEGGIPPLLKLLKEDSSPEAQIATSTTLFNLANNQDRARLIIVQSFQKSPIRVQISIVKIIARMAENDDFSQEAFARENVIRPLVRRAAFKSNSPAAKAVIDQLLRLIHDSDSDDTLIKISVIRAIGHLAWTFPARETRIIGPLVKQLCHRNPKVRTESAIALRKFSCPENFLCTEHSNTIIEFDGVVPLMRLLRGNERTQYHGLVHLAMHVGNSEALVKARVLTAVEGADRSIVGQHSELKDLVAQAIYHLNMYSLHSKIIVQF